MNDTAIYLDTNLWNALVNQSVDPHYILTELKYAHARLALSGQTVYELAKTFASKPQRAVELFQYLKQYVNDIVGAYDTMEQLHHEVDAINTGASSVEAFYGAREYSALRAHVDKLALGELNAETQLRVASGNHFAQAARSSQKAHLDSKPEVKDRLKAVAQGQLSRWLQSEMLSDRGTALLLGHLRRMYGDSLPEGAAVELAHALLRTPLFRAAKGIIRADLYSNWRCANRDSLRSDLIDDMYHVLNASYCAVYATAESKQAEYAAHLLSDQTQVSIYDVQAPIAAWLVRVASQLS